MMTYIQWYVLTIKSQQLREVHLFNGVLLHMSSLSPVYAYDYSQIHIDSLYKTCSWVTWKFNISKYRIWSFLAQNLVQNNFRVLGIIIGYLTESDSTVWMQGGLTCFLGSEYKEAPSLCCCWDFLLFTPKDVLKNKWSRKGIGMGQGLCPQLDYYTVEFIASKDPFVQPKWTTINLNFQFFPYLPLNH